ncbi:kinase-like domain-containing protein, partial [Dimargaris cristalligena]
QQLLLRIYGIGVDQLFEREKELYWLARLSELGIGPRMLAVFENGRVEEYLESTTLTRTDIRDPATSRHIAKRMCELHSIVNTFKPRPGCVPEVWVCIDKWYGTVSRKWAALESRLVKHGKPVDQLHIHKLGEDLDYLKARITAINSPIVFGHNDLQYGNILRLSDGSDELVVIDFEYAGYNYRGYDIANHFCEWAADYHSSAPHALDYTAYPTEEEQTRFLNAYIDEQIKLDPKKCPPEFLNDRAQALTSLLLEVACFRTASHLLWGLWGLLQASESDIDFDYFEYARQRLVAFREEL